MAFKTMAGLTPAQADAAGLRQFAAGMVPSAADYNRNWEDCQAPAMRGLLAGILSGGLGITASGLNVTLPAGLAYYARQVWVNDAAVVVAVPDESSTWLWGCADGQVRMTSSASPPDGWSAYTACILALAAAASGTAALDLSAQEWARAPAARVASENAAVLAPQADVLPAGSWSVVPAGSQLLIMDALLVQGGLLVRGKVKVA